MRNAIIVLLLLGLIFQGCVQQGQPSQVSLGEGFTLHANESAFIRGEGLEVRVDSFIYSPCPPGAQCFWSGLGVVLEYKKGNETQKGVNLAEAFGYRTAIIDTDYKTYARLNVTKAAPNE
jgi:hypothetical protein